MIVNSTYPHFPLWTHHKICDQKFPKVSDWCFFLLHQFLVKIFKFSCFSLTVLYCTLLKLREGKEWGEHSVPWPPCNLYFWQFLFFKIQIFWGINYLRNGWNQVEPKIRQIFFFKCKKCFFFKISAIFDYFSYLKMQKFDYMQNWSDEEKN